MAVRTSLRLVHYDQIVGSHTSGPGGDSAGARNEHSCFVLYLRSAWAHSIAVKRRGF
jgi:hypothetical protein